MWKMESKLFSQWNPSSKSISEVGKALIYFHAKSGRSNPTFTFPEKNLILIFTFTLKIFNFVKLIFD